MTISLLNFPEAIYKIKRKYGFEKKKKEFCKKYPKSNTKIVSVTLNTQTLK